MNFVLTALTTLATIVVAWYAYSNHKLTREIRGSEERHQQELSALFQAIVIATLLTSSHDLKLTLDAFKQYYQGKTEIFKH